MAAEMVEAGSTGAGFNAVKAYAEYRSADKKKAVEELLELIQADPEDDVVQVVGATVLCLEDRTDEALDLLSKHEHNLEAYSVRQVLLADFRVGIIIQIRLAQHNHEAAEKELNAAKSWAQDSLLAQLAEAFTRHCHNADIRLGYPSRKEEKGRKGHITFTKNLLNHPLLLPSHSSAKQFPKSNLADYRKPNLRSSRLLKKPRKIPISSRTPWSAPLSRGRITRLISSLMSLSVRKLMRTAR